MSNATQNFLKDGFSASFRDELFSEIYVAVEIIRNEKSDSGTVYHYTDARGLRGIIEDNCLWSTHGRYQNDSREILHGRDLFSNVSKEIARQLPASPQQEVFNAVSSRLKDEAMVSCFLTCFARASDQLSQWRGYGDRGKGYSIGFDVINLASRLNGIGYPLDVIYELETQRKITTAILKTYWEYIEKQRSVSWIKTYQYDLRDFLISMALIFAASFKDEGFLEEKEFRYVMMAPDSRIDNLVFRERNGLITPYQLLKVEADANRISSRLIVEPYKQNKQSSHLFPITSITTGPGLDAELAIGSLKNLLQKNGYDTDAIEIKPSIIPFLS